MKNFFSLPSAKFRPVKREGDCRLLKNGAREKDGFMDVMAFFCTLRAEPLKEVVLAE